MKAIWQISLINYFDYFNELFIGHGNNCTNKKLFFVLECHVFFLITATGYINLLNVTFAKTAAFSHTLILIIRKKLLKISYFSNNLIFLANKLK